jgi:hypothetical protein
LEGKTVIYAENITPTGLAARLAEYITDPSTIRARVKGHFGRAPTIEQCRNLRRAVENRRMKHVSHADHKFRTYCAKHDGPYEMDADGIDRCSTCKQEKRRAELEKELAHIRRLLDEKERKQEEANRAIRDALDGIDSLPRAEFNTVVQQVAKSLGLSIDELLGPRRNQYIVDGRAVVVRALRNRNKQRWSFPNLGRHMGRDHTTLVALDQGFDIRAKRNPVLAELVDMIA